MSNKICSKINFLGYRIIFDNKRDIIVQGKMPDTWRYCQLGNSFSKLIYSDFGGLWKVEWEGAQITRWAFYRSSNEFACSIWNWSEADIDHLIGGDYAQSMTVEEVNKATGNI